MPRSADSGLSLDLGSGPVPAPGYVGVDLCEPDPDSQIIRADLLDGSPWPFDDGSVRRLRASHLIEHIPHGRVPTGELISVRRRVMSPGQKTQDFEGRLHVTKDTFFHFFDEAWRIAAPGCRFELAWPHPLSDGADQDPTHCRRIPIATLSYLSREGRRVLRVHHYPVTCDWQIEPGSCHEFGPSEVVGSFARADGSLDIDRARRHHGVFFEIRATLFKPGPPEPSAAMGRNPEE